ncbi:hypothetical protein [Streptomyces sp. NPDC086023]|uniref:hypothetical protein n=1 Tax=Streptomyces sp. NPDC086023 TaxID=3365746 RepID=UPI0037D13A0B
METSAQTMTLEQSTQIQDWLARNPQISSALHDHFDESWTMLPWSDFKVLLEERVLNQEQTHHLKTTLLDQDSLVGMAVEQRHLALIYVIWAARQRAPRAKAKHVPEEAINAMGQWLAANDPKLLSAINKYAEVLSAFHWEGVQNFGIFQPRQLSALNTAVRTLWSGFSADTYVTSLLLAARGYSGGSAAQQEPALEEDDSAAEGEGESEEAPLPEGDLLAMNSWLLQNPGIREQIAKSADALADYDWDTFEHAALLKKTDAKLLKIEAARLWKAHSKENEKFIPALLYIVRTFAGPGADSGPSWLTPRHKNMIEVLWPGADPLDILSILLPNWPDQEAGDCVRRLNAKLERRVAKMKPPGLDYPEVIEATISGVTRKKPVENGTYKALVKDGRGDKVYARGGIDKPTKNSHWHHKATPAESPEPDAAQKDVIATAKVFAADLARAAASHLWELSGQLDGVLTPEAKMIRKLYVNLLNANPTVGSVTEAATFYETLAENLDGIPVLNWHKGHERQGPDVTDSVRAFTTPGRADIPVHVTPAFYEVSPEMQAFDLLHESTHMYHSTTDDGGSDVGNLRNNSEKGLGLQRAYNIEWFARAVFRADVPLPGGATSDDEPDKKYLKKGQANAPIVSRPMSDDQTDAVEAARASAAGHVDRALKYLEAAAGGGHSELAVEWFGKSWKSSLPHLRKTFADMSAAIGRMPVLLYGGGDLKAKFTAYTDFGKAVYVADAFFDDFSAEGRAFVILHESSHYVHEEILDHDLSRANGTSIPGARLIAQANQGTAAYSAYNIQYFAESVAGRTV